jgi:Uma2 family endonuclease
MEFPISDVMQQRRQFAENFIAPFRTCQEHRIPPHPVNMPPVMAGRIVFDSLPDKIRRTGNQRGTIVHRVSFVSLRSCLPFSGRRDDNQSRALTPICEQAAMSAILESTAPDWTLGDLYERFGPIPLSRIRRSPEPGTATEDDVLEIHDREGRACELVDGILVEKTMGQYESMLAVRIAWLLMNFVNSRKLGSVFGEAGFMKLKPGLIRIPDVSFVSKERMKTARIRPGGKIQPLVPELAVEVLSPGNTKQEMDRKLEEFFQAGVQLVWYVDPRIQRVTVYHSEKDSETLQPPAELKGDPVLPGLSISLTELFAPPEEE